MIDTNFSNLSREQIEAGFFEPTNHVHMPASVETTHWFDPVWKPARVLYYPGAFTLFHKGHLQVIIEAYMREKVKDFVIAVAPSHVEYADKKYPLYDVSNHERFWRVAAYISNLPPEIRKHVVIDTAPMLEYQCDQNFTTLLNRFVEKMEMEPDADHAVVCGKDKKWFGLTELTGLRVAYIEGNTISSRNMINHYFKPNRKHLLLRCWSKEQAQVFEQYMGRYYDGVEMIDMAQELEQSLKLAKSMGITDTICKDYADHLTYHKFSRQYQTPLARESFIEPDFNGATSVIDSDIYSGNTRFFLNERGITVVSNLDLSINRVYRRTELLDIADFYDPQYCYPNVDMSRKCSMPSFKPFDHNNLAEFKTELAKLPAKG